MDREIDFRGKVKKSKYTYGGGWSYGLLSEKITGTYVCSSGLELDIKDYAINGFLVEEDTIGQSVGQKDFGGKVIYEGDIVRLRDNDEIVFIVAYNPQVCAFGLVTKQMWKDRAYGYAWRYFSTYKGRDLVLIGNIYDNPEFLNA